MTIVDFKNFILRKLGYPLHSIEITDDQLEDCITEAVDRFTERHYDSVIQNVYKLNLVGGQSSYQLPETIKTVINILPSNNVFSNMSNYENMLIPVMPMPYQDYLWKLSDVTAIASYRMSVKTWEDFVSNQNVIFDFNYSMHRLNIMGDINKLASKYPTDSFFLVVYESPMEELDDLYNNRWLKQYAVALAKKQWATNLKKYNGAQLAGGAELNHEGLMSDANDEIQRLEEQLEDEFTLPPSFMVG